MHAFAHTPRTDIDAISQRHSVALLGTEYGVLRSTYSALRIQRVGAVQCVGVGRGSLGHFSKDASGKGGKGKGRGGEEDGAYPRSRDSAD